MHFFNRWPLPSPPKREFLRCFPSRTWNIANMPDPNNFTLVDATPDYMFNAMAPPRIKAIWPNAKFLVLLRVRAWPAVPSIHVLLSAVQVQSRRASVQVPKFGLHSVWLCTL